MSVNTSAQVPTRQFSADNPGYSGLHMEYPSNNGSRYNFLNFSTDSGGSSSSWQPDFHLRSSSVPHSSQHYLQPSVMMSPQAAYPPPWPQQQQPPPQQPPEMYYDNIGSLHLTQQHLPSAYGYHPYQYEQSQNQLPHSMEITPTPAHVQPFMHQRLTNNSAPQASGDNPWSAHGSTHSLTTRQTSMMSDPCAKITEALLCHYQGTDDIEFVRRAIDSLVKKLKDKREELDALITAVTSVGKEPTICVTIQKSLDGRLQIAGKKGHPLVIYTRIFRWSAVSKTELHKLNICKTPGNHPELICVNPYHYDRVVPSCYSNNISPLSYQPNQFSGYDYLNDYNQPGSAMTSAGFRAPSTCSNEPTHMDTCAMQVDSVGPSMAYAGEPSGGVYLGNQVVVSRPLVPAPGTFFIYSPEQQPSSVVTHHPDGSVTVDAKSLPSFVSQDFTQKPMSMLLDNNVIIERYNNLKAQMENVDPITPHHSSLTDWCSISYYELNTQIGETFNIPFVQNKIVVDGGMDPGSATTGRICLGAIPNVHRTEPSEKARMGIGPGIQLEHCEDGSVNLSVLSQKAVFVRSYYLDFENNATYGSTVHKMCTGVSKKVFDLRWACVEMQEQQQVAQRISRETANAVAGRHAASTLLQDRSLISVDDLSVVCCTLAISFVKGWGPGYNQTLVKNTPCWIEVQIHRSLDMLNDLCRRDESQDTYNFR